MSVNMPMVEPGMTRREKEMFFATTFIMDRLKDLRMDENFELKKWILFTLMVMCSIIGSFIIMAGMAYSIFFQGLKPSMTVVAVGAIFLIPFVLWLKYICCPVGQEAEERKHIYRTRSLLADSNVDDALVQQSKEFSRPPTQRIPCYFFLRKKKYKIIASTMREFSELVEKETDIPMNQQMFKYNGPRLAGGAKPSAIIGEYFDIHLDWRLVEDYRFHAGFEVIVYNRGAYESYLLQLEKKMEKNPNHSCFGKIEVKVVEYHEPNAVELLGTSISQDVIDELHREVEAVSYYEEAPPIGSKRIKPAAKLVITPAQLNNKQVGAHKIEKKMSDKIYRIVDPRILAQIEMDKRAAATINTTNSNNNVGFRGDKFDNKTNGSGDNRKQSVEESSRGYSTGTDDAKANKSNQMKDFLQKEHKPESHAFDDGDEDVSNLNNV